MKKNHSLACSKEGEENLPKKVGEDQYVFEKLFFETSEGPSFKKLTEGKKEFPQIKKWKGRYFFT